ncbi:putative acetyltransferase [Natronincola peptidivorans]|uniref:Putative acetyltransferase n=1 Tax=Natronincola peptidivorans TaxID=426128 RepID=A0A1I0EE01_9FIRM|nr:GNAT family N-acetyltransferase [Natronincola peptidivorans]SET42967.1 putative acetyltransferase [Natronincola peptidivorans]
MNNHDIKIREFNVNDQSGVASLQEEFIKEFFPEFQSDPRQYDWNADIYDIEKYYTEHGGMFWVIEKNNSIIGVGGFRLVSPTIAEIKRVRISINHREKGLGKTIIRTIEDYCRQHKVQKILVDTDERLTTAKAMYEKLGYTIYKKETEIEGNESYVNYYFEKDIY